jgi:hypothetical protein
MTPLAILFTLVASIALLGLPRRWATVPLLAGACYMTVAQRIEIGPFTLHVVRLLIAVGALRVIMRGERLVGGLNGLDRIMLAFGVWTIFSSLFHKTTAEGNPLIFRLGLVYNLLGIYFIFRHLIQNLQDVENLIKAIACVLFLVAVEMIQEHVTKHNMFSIFGGVPEMAWIRDGKLRSQGPFSHPILAGSVGAVCLPLMIGLYRLNTRASLLGIIGCVGMVFASSSSGPLMSLMVSIFALILWRWRHFTSRMRVAIVFGYILLSLIMTDPAYYIIARIDLTGSSTGWHRAKLIEMGITHLNEWWLGGTDYTRHWMPTGVSWSEEHTDITNYYLKMGVIGGLPLMGLFIAALLSGFQYIGQSLRLSQHEPWEQQFMIWSVGAALLSHVATCISVSYFDQSYIFLFLNLALINSLRSAILLKEVDTEENEKTEDDELTRHPRSEMGASSFGTPSAGVAGLRFS